MRASLFLLNLPLFGGAVPFLQQHSAEQAAGVITGTVTSAEGRPIRPARATVRPLAGR